VWSRLVKAERHRRYIMPPTKKGKTAGASAGNNTIEQVFAVKWAVEKKIDKVNRSGLVFFDRGRFAVGDEVDAVEQQLRDDEETEETGLADAVYASRESAMISASIKFAELCEDYWKKGEDDPDSDEDDEDEEGEDVEEEHTGEAGDGYPKYTPMMRPSRYKTANVFEWAGYWEHEDGHQMSSSVKVTVSALKVLP